MLVAFEEPVPLPKAAQVVKFFPPKNCPTVTASVMCNICNSAAAVVAFVAQKLMVKLDAVALPPQIGCHTWPSKLP